ncbi:hypothetical protein SBV1_3290004 [Verrucomicrobia bacterium]|nr:hypothetical protein SBV1_3290004 [Verrucomicrobiota bacterium]
MEQVTPILAAAGAGDAQMAEQLLPLVYEELRRWQFDTCVQVPMFNRRAIHFNVIVVCWRTPQAICTFSGPPLRRRLSSASVRPRRRNCPCTRPSAWSASA